MSITLFFGMSIFFTFMTNSISNMSVSFLIIDDSVVFKTIMSSFFFLFLSKCEFKISIFLVNYAKLSFWVYIMYLSIDSSLSSIFSFKLSLFLGLLFVHPLLTSSTKVLLCLSFSISSFISNFLRIAFIFTLFVFQFFLTSLLLYLFLSFLFLYLYQLCLGSSFVLFL